MTRGASPPANAAQPVDSAAQHATDSSAAQTDAIDRASEIAVQAWETKLFTVQNATVTVGQIVIAIGVLVLGVLLARIISRRIGAKVLPRMKVDPGPAHAIEAILFYGLLSMVVLLSLEIAAVPLTIFTIFGGALALGVGFGSQNIMNNFISGLILLIEQPIQVGHFIEVDGDKGTVAKVGARATQIAEYSGARHIIPNSKLLEHTVTNWHVPTPEIRSCVTVGVAYGSPVLKVREILEQVVRENDRVIKAADNRVIFSEFGDSALNFECHYWHRPESQLERRDQESEIRFAIDKAFANAGIVIAFPQRDIHLDTPGRPLEIRMVESKPGSKAATDPE